MSAPVSAASGTITRARGRTSAGVPAPARDIAPGAWIVRSIPMTDGLAGVPYVRTSARRHVAYPMACDPVAVVSHVLPAYGTDRHGESGQRAPDLYA